MAASLRVRNQSCKVTTRSPAGVDVLEGGASRGPGGLRRQLNWKGLQRRFQNMADS